MAKLILTVIDNVLKARLDGVATSDTVGLPCSVTFSNEWTEYGKTIFFYQNPRKAFRKVIAGQAAEFEIPSAAIVADGRLFIGVIGNYTEDGKTPRKVATPACVNITKGSYSETNLPEPPSLSEYEQMISLMMAYMDAQELVEKAEEHENAAESFANDAERFASASEASASEAFQTLLEVMAAGETAREEISRDKDAAKAEIGQVLSDSKADIAEAKAIAEASIVSVGQSEEQQIEDKADSLKSQIADAGNEEQQKLATLGSELAAEVEVQVQRATEEANRSGRHSAATAQYSDLAQSYAQEAATSAGNAGTHENAAKESATKAERSANDAATSKQSASESAAESKASAVASEEAAALSVSTVENAKTEIKAEAESIYGELKADYPKTVSRVSAVEKRVTNLEQAITPSPFVTDDAVAYGKIVPDNALPYAEVLEIGGMTRKCTNLIPYPYSSISLVASGINFTANTNGGVTVKGTSTAVAYYVLFGGYSNDKYPIPSWLNEGETYTIHRVGEGAAVEVYFYSADGESLAFSTGGSNTKTFVCPSGYSYIGIFIKVSSGATVDTTIYPMLNEGETALPYEPYFEGLRSAPVTEVKSIGRNFVDMSRFSNPDNWEATSGHARSVVYMGVLPAGTYIASAEFNGSVEPYLTVQSLSEDGTRTSLAVVYQGSYMSASNRRFTIDKPAKILLWTYWGALNSLADTIKQFDKIQIVRGETDTEYVPYKGSSLFIPEVVRGLDGHGLGAGTYGNSVNFATRKYTKSFGVVDLGTLQWYYSDFDGKKVFSTFDLEKLMKSGTRNVVSPIPFLIYADIWGNELDNVFFVNGTAIRGVFTQYTDATSFKAAMSGVMLVYELATPEVVDISDILPTDNYIEVESGGTVTMVNEYGYDVPSAITYQIKGVTE